MTNCQKNPPCGIFLKRGLFKDVKNDIPMCQKRKYKNTSTQIHKHTNTQMQHMTKCQKNPTCGISLKRGLFKDIKNDISMCQKRKYKIQIHKHKNTQIQDMTKCQSIDQCLFVDNNPSDFPSDKGC